MADLKDTYMDLQDLSEILNENIEMKRTGLEKLNQAYSADRDQQKLYNTIDRPANIILDVGEKAGYMSDPKKSFDQVRLVQIANANYKAELGKYNASFSGNYNSNDLPDYRALGKGL